MSTTAGASQWLDPIQESYGASGADESESATSSDGEEESSLEDSQGSSEQGNDDLGDHLAFLESFDGDDDVLEKYDDNLLPDFVDTEIADPDTALLPLADSTETKPTQQAWPTPSTTLPSNQVAECASLDDEKLYSTAAS